jgi:glycosyltransferase involved in cell wall biosynthesis
MRLLIVIDDPRLPSSRVSALQYVDLLKAAGYDAEVFALRDPQLVQRQERARQLTRRLRVTRVGLALAERMDRRHQEELIERARNADVVYVVKAPHLQILQRLAALRGPKLLFHISDAFWLPFLRRHGWESVHEMLKIAGGVTTTNEFTADRIRPHNRNVFVVPDSPQVEDFDLVRSDARKSNSEVIVGWIGTPLTATSLFRIWEPLERLAALRSDWSLRLVGTGSEQNINIPRFESVRWSALPWYDQQSMIDEVLAMDIGLFPLFRGDDALARGALKAAIYMSGEAAVVAQRYGEAPEFIEDGVNGMLADSDDEWIEKISYLIEHPDARRAIAARGLETVRERFSRARTFEQLRHAIDSV